MNHIFSKEPLIKTQNILSFWRMPESSQNNNYSALFPKSLYLLRPFSRGCWCSPARREAYLIIDILIK